jgi:hypothetical protein
MQKKRFMQVFFLPRRTDPPLPLPWRPPLKYEKRGGFPGLFAVYSVVLFIYTEHLASQ